MRYFYVVVAAALLIASSPTFHATAAGDAAPGGDCQASCDCQTSCPRCNLKVSLEKIKKHCYRVGCKTVCIPRVTFPWQICKDKGCNRCGCTPCICCPNPPNGARLRTVNVLKKFEYECERCKYKWTPETDKCGCGDGSSCTSPGTAPDADKPPTPPAVTAGTEPFATDDFVHMTE